LRVLDDIFGRLVIIEKKRVDWAMLTVVYIILMFLLFGGKDVLFVEFYEILLGGHTEQSGFVLIYILVSIMFFFVLLNTMLKDVKPVLDMELMILSRYEFNHRKYYIKLFAIIMRKMICGAVLILGSGVVAGFFFENAEFTFLLCAMINYIVFMFIMIELLLIFHVVGVGLEVSVPIEIIVLLILNIIFSILNIDFVGIYSFRVTGLVIKIIISIILSGMLLVEGVYHRLLERRFV
jgi:hypothetical protein